MEHIPTKESHIPDKTNIIRSVTFWGLLVNILLSGFKFFAGVFSGSQALIADGVHSLSDSFSDLIVLFGVGFWSAPADIDHPHGHGRIETLVTFFIGILLAGAGLGLAYKAIVTLHGQHASNPGWAAFGVACLSILSKEALYIWNLRVGTRIKSMAMIANAWHHRTDSLSSIPVALAVLGTRIKPSWGFLDHMATVMVSFLIIQAAWGICWPALQHLIDTGVSQKELEELMEISSNVAGVKAIHALRTRNIGSGLQVDLHVQVTPELSVREGHAIAGAVKARLLSEGPDIVDVLVHLEPFEEE
ncbi:cation diffusion facilitator family transporter [Candidatus Riflebacteria bacterium]